MAKQRKTTGSTKGRSGKNSTAQSKVPKKTRQLTASHASTTTQNINQVPATQPVTAQKEHQEITAAKILGGFTFLATLITAIVTIVANFPQYSLNLSYIHASQTANSVFSTQTSQALSITALPQTVQPNTTITPNVTITPTVTITYTLRPEHLDIKRFLEELAVITERAISENKWELLKDYYCGQQANIRLDNFRLWVATLGENATARRIGDNSSLEIIANPKPNMDWKVVQIETWLFSGEKQQITLKHVDTYTYYLKRTPTNTYCIFDYETDRINYDILPK